MRRAAYGGRLGRITLEKRVISVASSGGRPAAEGQGDQAELRRRRQLHGGRAAGEQKDLGVVDCRQPRQVRMLRVPVSGGAFFLGEGCFGGFAAATQRRSSGRVDVMVMMVVAQAEYALRQRAVMVVAVLFVGQVDVRAIAAGMIVNDERTSRDQTE
jgi:hypothetical protein